MKKRYMFGISIIALLTAFMAYKIYVRNEVKNSLVFTEFPTPYLLERTRDIKRNDIFIVKEGIDNSKVQVTFIYDTEKTREKQRAVALIKMNNEVIKHSFPLLIQDSFPVEIEYKGKTKLKKGEVININDGLVIYDIIGEDLKKEPIDFNVEPSTIKASYRVENSINLSNEGIYEAVVFATDGHGVIVTKKIEFIVE